MPEIAERLERSRFDLLDLTLRNPLLNYKTTKAKGVDIIHELPKEVFRILVANDKAMSFLSVKGDDADDENEDEQLPLPYLSQPEEVQVAINYTDDRLQTPYTSSVLQRRLLNTYYTAKGHIEEQGVNILFLALGVLNWKESDQSEEIIRAPLILIPVTLDRKDAQSRFKVTYNSEDILSNISLREKLKNEFSLALPDFDEEKELECNPYFETVQNIIKKKKGWWVDDKAIHLGFFSFSKYRMWKDLDANVWPSGTGPLGNILIQALLGNGFGGEPEDFPDANEVDKIVKPSDIYPVMDADSSQIAALLAVRKGMNLVIQGPPGTGKSQTIANILCDAVAAGKTVLFVAEKRAALEVVKRRMDKAGIGDACLELHSHKANKKDVLNNLQAAMELGKPTLEDSLALERDLLRERTDINVYAAANNTPIGDSGISPIQAYAHYLKLMSTLEAKNPPSLSEGLIKDWSREDFEKKRRMVQELQGLIAEYGTPIQNPFYESRITSLLPIDKPSIGKLYTAVDFAIKESQNSSLNLANVIGMTPPMDSKTILYLIELCDCVHAAPSRQNIPDIFALMSNHGAEIDALCFLIERYKEIHTTHDSVFLLAAWNVNANNIRGPINAYGRKWYRFLMGDYRKAIRELKMLYRSEAPKSVEEKIKTLDLIIEAADIEQKINSTEPLVYSPFSNAWHGLKTDTAHIKHWTAWKMKHSGILNKGIQDFKVGKITEDAIRVWSAENAQILERAKNAYFKYTTCMQHLSERLKFAPDGAGKQPSLFESSFDAQLLIIHNWQTSFHKLEEITKFNRTRDVLKAEGLLELFDTSVKWEHAAFHLESLFSYERYQHLISKAHQERPILAKFDGPTHAKKIEEFKKYDRSYLIDNRRRVAASHWQSIPKYDAAGQLGLLKRQFQLQRRHLPLRKLMEKAGAPIQKIKPIFMMSPLSIAAFLPPGTLSFDLAIYDEASQIKPVDAFGAILRAKQVVVVGDSQQLPPTNFFEKAVSGELNDEDDGYTSDIESILGLFVSQGAPESMLRWHYRSRHESLISVSNYEFYKNKLVVFPGTDAARNNFGLRFFHLPNSYYEVGKRINIEEAKTVAKAVMEHAKKTPKLSLGVAAFSISQMQAIQDQVEILRRQDNSFEDFFSESRDEPFFIKNLESVQGDERDVIILSIGYGRTAEGKLSMSFGPLNGNGGERRLNVLITRARVRCDVYSSLTSDDIDLNRTESRGVAVFKRFLKYAQTGNLDVPDCGKEGCDSPFEEMICDDLIRLGYKIKTQVGSGGYFIDMAVVDETKLGRYILGIECDGAMYHSSRVARDRDRLRQEVLENLGWTIYRIWSTDWFRNPEKELRKAVDCIEKTKTVTDSKAASQSADRETKAIRRVRPKESEIEPPKAELYKKTKLSIYKDFDSASLSEIASWMEKIVDAESPIHEDLLLRRIGELTGKRQTERVSGVLSSALNVLRKSPCIAKSGSFYLKNDNSDFKLRDYSSLSGTEKKIAYVYPEILKIALVKAAQITFGAVKEELYRQAARMVGFEKVTDDIWSAFEPLIKELVLRDVFSESEGVFTCKQVE